MMSRSDFKVREEIRLAIHDYFLTTPGHPHNCDDYAHLYGLLDEGASIYDVVFRACETAYSFGVDDGRGEEQK